MTDDASGHEGDPGDPTDWDAAGEPTTGSTPRIEEPVPHNRLVGYMAFPISRSVPVRRSTVLMVLAFLGFGTLGYLYPPTTTVTPNNPGVFLPGVIASTTTTTTTTVPPTTTTTTTAPPRSTTTTTAPQTTTTSTSPRSSTSTSAPPTSTTTTTSPGAASTTTTMTTAP